MSDIPPRHQRFTKTRGKREVFFYCVPDTTRDNIFFIHILLSILKILQQFTTRGSPLLGVLDLQPDRTKTGFESAAETDDDHIQGN
jgi:hypothetical protein